MLQLTTGRKIQLAMYPAEGGGGAVAHPLRSAGSSVRTADGADDQFAYRAFMRIFAGSDRKEALTGSLRDCTAQDLLPRLKADRVSPILLKKLGIEFETVNNKVVLSEQLVGKLRELFMALEPLPDTNRRVCVIGPGRDGSTNPAIRGALLYFYNAPNGRRAKLYFELTGAHRKTLHQEGISRDEHGKLPEISSLTSLLSEALVSWGSIDSQFRRQLIANSKRLDRRASRILPRPHNPAKMRVREILARSAGLSDARDRLNPNAARVSYSSAARLLRKRFVEARAIGRHNHDDLTALTNYLRREDTRFQHMRAQIAQAGGCVKRLLSDERLNKEQRRAQIERFIVRLGISEEQLAGLSVRPFLTYATAIAASRSELRSAALEESLTRSVDQALSALATIRAVTTIADFQRQLGLARLELVAGAAGVAQAVQRTIALCQQYAIAQQRGENIELFFASAFRGVGRILQLAEERLRKSPLPPQKSSIRKLKEFYTKIDFETRLRQEFKLR